MKIIEGSVIGRVLTTVLTVCASLIMSGCTEQTENAVTLEFVNGTSTVCERGYFSDEDTGGGYCYHADGSATKFQWLKGTKVAPVFPPVQVVVYQPVTPEPTRSWKAMEAFDTMIAKVEGVFERWIGEFEQRPFATGFRALLAFLLIRFVYRKLLKG